MQKAGEVKSAYVVFINFTAQGIRTISDWLDRVSNARQAIEKAGGSL